MAEKRKNLYYLDELSDYKVSDEDPDVRGWDVKDKDNRVIGKVEDLLVNKNREQVVYLDVEVDDSIIEANHDPYSRSASEEVHEFINKDGEEHIIIPVGLVDVDKDRKFVYTDRIDYQTFSETKRYQKGSNVEREYEVVVLDSYDRFGDPDQNRGNVQTDREMDRGDFETKPDDTYNKDYTDKEGRSRDVSFEDDDESFYDRREFEGAYWRRNR